MWVIKDRTPFLSSCCFDRDINGSQDWCVIVRARFQYLLNGKLTLTEQVAPEVAPKFLDNKGEELLAESHVNPYCKQTDFSILGSIICPKDGVFEKPLYANVGSNKKFGKVFGNRVFRFNSGEWQLEEFSSLPDTTSLSWKNSYGGGHLNVNREWVLNLDNPIGTGAIFESECLVENDTIGILPSLDNCSSTPLDFSADRQPFGFGIINRSWSPRSIYAGTYDESWLKNRSPLLPTNFDSKFYQCTPYDQRFTNYVTGNELIEVGGFSEQDFVIKLPQIVLEAKTRIASNLVATRFKCVMVNLNIDDQTLDMVWNSSIPCNGLDHQLEYTIVSVKQMAGFSW